MRARNVVALVATTAVVVGGGSATAASMISGASVRNNSLTGADIRGIRGGDIKNGTLGCRDLVKSLRDRVCSVQQTAGSSSPGANGANGAPGARGPQGAAGANGQNGQNGENADGSVNRPVRASGDNGVTTFENGDATAEFAGGALQLAADTTAGPATSGLMVDGPINLADLERLQYDYRVDEAGSDQLAPAIRLTVTGTEGANSETVLVYEPTYSKPGGTLPQDQWVRDEDTIDGGSGRWWSEESIDGAENGQNTPLPTWAEILAANPGAVIQSIEIEAGMDFQGFPWTNFEGAVDNLIVGVTGEVASRYTLG
jgi:hypothetical protein